MISYISSVQPGVARWLARAAPVVVSAAAVALAGPASASGGQPLAGHGAAARMLLGQRIAAYAKTFVGRYPYRWGGDSPQTGFDCSGLTFYIYAQYGRAIPRTAEAQYLALRQVRRAWRGDLVFFHDSSGYVYHVGIYEGRGTLVAAADQQDGIMFETIWTAVVTYGTTTHH
jgi:cell wall-associated NlpC family hydrolase